MVGPEALHEPNENKRLSGNETLGKRKEIQLPLFPSVSLGEALRLKLDVVREAKALFGSSVAQRVWVELGLPGVSGAADSTDAPEGGAGRVSDRTRVGYHSSGIAAFVADCVVADQAASIPAGDLYAAYKRWRDGKPLPLLVPAWFGRYISASGIVRRKSNSTIYLAVRLR